ncbi:cytochrome P450 [Enhygromyxa salina]|uniref:Uncharacterized protein n=1 Tax=Enhygromyxa salina TaxID=215803 RepID=A0A2S9Y3H4_9BACT|nr:cytochrome P450 [Enhygromyxa salina]PRP99642.1 hypothetical protein ENSA7_62820 [Enhygromyxa salina]
MLMPLLAQENLRRAQGPAGQLTKSGVQATGLTLNWKCPA